MGQDREGAAEKEVEFHDLIMNEFLLGGGIA